MQVDGKDEGDLEDPLAETVNVEARFYEEGYTSGYDHGKLHGLFEGREVGREKCFELWEEIGYYEGQAGFWKGYLSVTVDPSKSRKGKDARALNHASILLGLIDGFPTTNPNPAASSDATSLKVDATTATIASDHKTPIEVEESNGRITTATAGVNPTSTSGDGDIDLPSLLSNIRARYRLLCSSLGVRPRLVPGAIVKTDNSKSRSAGGSDDNVTGTEGIVKGIDTSKLRF